MRTGLLLYFCSLQLRKSMSYRVDFWVKTVLNTLIGLGLVWYLWSSIFSSTGQQSYGGYTLPGMMLYYVLMMITMRFTQLRIGEMDLAEEIYNGSLSRYLVYPVRYLPIKYAQQMGGLVDVLLQALIAAIVLWLLFPHDELAAVTAANVIRALPALALGSLLAFLLYLPLQLVAFWADNVWSLVLLARFAAGLLGGGLLPLTLFPEASTRVLRLLPPALLYDFPVATMMGRIDTQQYLLSLASSLGWILLLGFVSHFVWRRGLLQYTGVGI